MMVQVVGREKPTNLKVRSVRATRSRMLLYAGVLVACTAAVASMEFVVTLQNSRFPGHPMGLLAWLVAFCVFLPPVSFAAVGAVIVKQHPKHRIGWLMIATGLTFAVGTFCTDYPHADPHTHHSTRPLAGLVAWVSTWEWSFYWSSLLLLFLLFPTDKLPGRKWIPLMWFGPIALGIDGVMYAVRQGPIDNVGIDNLSGIIPVPLVVSRPIDALSFAALAAAALSLIVRFRTARGDVRLQLKWFSFGAALAIALNIAAYLFSYGSLAGLGAITAVAALPIFMGIAILRYRLFAIDIILSTTLVYGTLTAFVIGTYVLVVGYVGTLFPSGGGVAISLVATGIVAVLFQPLRERLQRAVTQFVYGDRDDPYTVLARLGQRVQGGLASEDLLPAIVESIGRTLKLPLVSLSLRDDGNEGPVAEYHGQSAQGMGKAARLMQHTVTVPVLVQGEAVGELRLALRPGERKLGRADARLLDDLSRQAGIAVQAARLTGELRALTQDLQQSREQLVTAREEERRRLRRDLHDGLGPALASASFKVDAVRNLLRRDPKRADTLLRDVAEDMQATITDIRRLVYDLRPPALDQLGLVEGLRQYAQQLEGATRITVTAPEIMAPLPAAVEVAVYRIAVEAMTNVARHAGALFCWVHLAVGDGALVIEVADDGRGLPEERRDGVGFHSMQERAAELGGTCVILSPLEGGTTVRARVPLTPAHALPRT